MARKSSRRRGGAAALPPPLPAAPRRVAISIRVAPETLETFRATGPGWQVRMNHALDREAARLAAALEN